MSHALDREQFFSTLGGLGLYVAETHDLLRLAQRHQRLAIAICNGDYPADNGQRETRACPACELLWAPQSFRRGEPIPGTSQWTRECPDCHVERQLRALVDRINARCDAGLVLHLQGDPRGYTVRLSTPPLRDAWVDRGLTFATASHEAIGVPTR